MLSLTVQHCSTAVDGTAKACEFFLDPGCLTQIDHQTIIVREFLSDIDIAQGVKEDAVAILLCFQIWFTGVINPLGTASTVLGVDDVTVVQMEVKGVVGLTWVVWVVGFGFLPGDDLALILQHHFASLDRSDGVNALAVDARFAYLDAAPPGRLLN